MNDFMRDLSVKEMNILDQNTTDYGIPIDFLMECAGYSSAMTLKTRYNLNSNDTVAILCGTGNNGGDGFVIARHLSAQQISVKVILIGDPAKIRTQHAFKNWTILNNILLNLKISVITDSSQMNAKSIFIEDKKPNIVVDCLLGTGVKGKIREPLKSAINVIKKLKESEIPIISIDVPSGLDPDTGNISDISVEPDLLITFHRKKKGLMNPPFKIPEILVNSIGIPEDADMFVGTGDLKVTLKRRRTEVHKGQHGKVLIIGGSEHYSGAPALSGMAALEMDIDLVIVYAPRSVSNTIRAYSPNLIVREGKDKNISTKDVDEICDLIEWADSIVIGPGLGRSTATKEAISKIFAFIALNQKPLVIDADAIISCNENLENIKKIEPILTPHAGEFFGLTEINLPDQNSFKERAEILESVAKKYNATFLVKGKYDYISNGQNTRINKTGVPEMAVGGTGDILTGIVASLLALGVDHFDSACIGSYICGKLGEEYQRLRSQDFGNPIYTFKSSDLLMYISLLLSKYL